MAFFGLLTLKGALLGVAIGAVALSAPEARAACIGGDSVCTTFDPTTASTPTRGTGTFTGTSSSLTNPYQHVRVLFSVSNYSGTPVTLDNIILGGNGISSTLTGLGSLVINGNFGFTATAASAPFGYVPLNTSVSSLNFSSSTLKFGIPAGLGVGTTVEARIQYSDTNVNNDVSIVSSSIFTTTAATSSSVPGPLPLLGAGAAFGFSRAMRKRIKASAKA
jgi:hypothetical protein